LPDWFQHDAIIAKTTVKSLFFYSSGDPKP
jgi:hypothetical protein